MDVGMQLQGLTPGVQDHQPADVSSQVPRVQGNLQQRLPHGAKQDVIEHARMRRGYRGQLVRDGEHHMEVLDREQFLPAGLQPGGPITRLAFGTVPVATRVIDRRLCVASRAAQQVASHRGRATGAQRCQHFALLDAQVFSAGGEEPGSVTADDFADFDRRAGFFGAGAVAGTWRSCSSGSRSSDLQASWRWLRRTCV